MLLEKDHWYHGLDSYVEPHVDCYCEAVLRKLLVTWLAR